MTTIVWLRPQMAVTTVRQGTTRDDDNTTVRTDSNRGQQLQDDTHDDEDYCVCVRICVPRDHDGLMGANQVQTRWGFWERLPTIYLVDRSIIYQKLII